MNIVDRSEWTKREPPLYVRWTDPVEQWADGKWYFWDEAQMDAYGPFDSQDQANSAVAEYARTL